jgi:hypothetical protein
MRAKAQGFNQNIIVAMILGKLTLSLQGERFTPCFVRIFTKFDDNPR